jgi:hypothetical protein
LFDRLLEVHSRDAAARSVTEGIAISVLAHALLIGGAWVGTRLPAPLPTDPEESMSVVQYLLPKEQLEGSRPQPERLSWATLETTRGDGFDEKKDPPRDEEQPKIVVAKGEELDDEKGEEIPPPQPPIELGDSIKTVLEVDSAVVRYENSAAPPYPETMLKRRIEGMVIVQYVVDTTGHADTATFRVLTASHVDFARSVKNTLPLMRFHPAMMGSRRVPQLVEQPFVFKIVDTVRVAKKPPAGR